MVNKKKTRADFGIKIFLIKFKRNQRVAKSALKNEKKGKKSIDKVEGISYKGNHRPKGR